MAAGGLSAGLAFHIAHNALGLGGAGLDGLVNDWLYNALIVGAAAVCLARVPSAGRHRQIWLALGSGISLWAVGEILYSALYGASGDAPIPSIADPLWLAFYPCAFVAVALVARESRRPFDLDLWLDAATVAAAVGAVTGAMLLDPVIELTGGDAAAVATNLSYPLADLLLLGLVAWTFGIAGWRPLPVLLVFGAGLAVAAIADSIYLYRTAQGSYEVGTLLDSLWPAAMLLLAAAAWTRGLGRATVASANRGSTGLRMPVIPAAAGAAALGVLLYAAVSDVGPLTLALATVSIGLLIVRAARSIRQLAAAAMLAERQRLARDLHDGVAQDVAFVASQARTLAAGGSAVVSLDGLADAASRALDHARDAIAALTPDNDEPLDRAIERVAAELDGRTDAAISLHLARGAATDPRTNEQLVKIVREAIINAIEHSGADRIEVGLEIQDGIAITVADDGCGIDPAANSDRLGLRTMRERAALVGATLSIDSARRGGSRVRVTLS